VLRTMRAIRSSVTMPVSPSQQMTRVSPSCISWRCISTHTSVFIPRARVMTFLYGKRFTCSSVRSGRVRRYSSRSEWSTVRGSMCPAARTT